MNDATESERRKELVPGIIVTAQIPLGSAVFQLSVFEEAATRAQHIALVLGSVSDASAEPLLVRVHSECMTGDVFGSTRCDCGAQLQEALSLIASRGRGALIYLRQEGRGIGLLGKLRAYNLQDSHGLDTVEANLALGYRVDQRTFGVAAEILAELGAGPIELLTNNPRKVTDLRDRGVKIASVLASKPALTEQNVDYLRTKRNRLGHIIPGIDGSPLGAAAETGRPVRRR